MSTVTIISLVTLCLLGIVPCCLSQSVAISVSPDIIYLGSDVDITCRVSGNVTELISYVPFYVINGTYIPHSCVGNAEYQPLTQRFSTPTSNNTLDNSTLSTRLSISPVTSIDMDLNISCVFFDLQTENNFSSQIITLSVMNTSQPTTPVETTTTQQMVTELPFINSNEFYITVGTVGGFIVLVIVVAIVLVLLILILVVVTKRNKRKETSETVTRLETEVTTPVNEEGTSMLALKNEGGASMLALKNEGGASMLALRKEEDMRDRADSRRTYNESEAQRYSALPTYSLALHMSADEFTESTDPSAVNQFSAIDEEKEKQETDS